MLLIPVFLKKDILFFVVTVEVNLRQCSSRSTVVVQWICSHFNIMISSCHSLVHILIDIAALLCRFDVPGIGTAAEGQLTLWPVLDTFIHLLRLKVDIVCGIVRLLVML